MKKMLLASFALLCAVDLAQAQTARIADRDIIDAYEYMLGRLLVLRQEALDLKEGMKWNEIVHREPGGVAWANPNLDVAYSEAWIALDENSCTLVELPEIKNRYYTFQVLNGWGEVTANINERNYPKHAFGKFMLCIKPAKITLPKGVIRIDLPSRKSRALFRIELGANPAEALALQKRVTIKAMGSPENRTRPWSNPIFPTRGCPASRRSTRPTRSSRARTTSISAWSGCRRRRAPFRPRSPIRRSAPVSTISSRSARFRVFLAKFQKSARR